MTFEKTVALISAKPAPGAKPIKMDTKKKLMFYALYKQATEGKNKGKQPRRTDMINFYKWKAWTQCGDMSKDEAKANYMKLAKSVAPALMAKL